MILPSTDKKLGLIGLGGASVTGTGIYYRDENGTVRAAMTELGLIYWDIFGNPRACTISASVLMGLNLRGSLIC